MPDYVIYRAPNYQVKPPQTDNAEEVAAFIGPQPPCPFCNNHGEYETGYGPRGCQPCNSRLIAFIDFSGERVYADWRDTIERREDGLHLVRCPELKIFTGASA